MYLRGDGQGTQAFSGKMRLYSGVSSSTVQVIGVIGVPGEVVRLSLILPEHLGISGTPHEHACSEQSPTT